MSDTAKAAHTPGPLSVVDGRQFGSKEMLVTCQIDGHSIPIADFHFQTGLRGIVLPAMENAALYAAASDMLAALIELMTACQEQYGVPCGGMMQNARAAISKATGTL